MIDYSTQAATMTASIFAFRSAAITSENKATPMARGIIAAMLAGVANDTSVVTTVLAAFRNPVGKSGKPLAKLNSAGDHLPGFGAMRKTVADIFAVYEARNVCDAVMPLITAFVLDEKDAPKSLRALKLAVNAAVAAHVKANAPEPEKVDGEEGDGDANGQTDGQTDAAPMALADRVNMLTVAMAVATDDDLSVAYDAFAALFAAFNARVAAATDPAEDVEPIAANG